MTRGVLLLIAALLAGLTAACTEPSPQVSDAPTTTLDANATAQAFVDAVISEDSATLATLTDEAQVALLLGMEGLSAEEVERMLSAGVGSASSDLFWTSFAQSLPAFAGVDSAALRAGTSAAVEGAPSFVVIDLESATGGAAPVVLRNDRGWVVDLLATAGPELAAPMRLWLATLPTDESGSAVRAALSSYRSSLDAALLARPEGAIDPATRLEIQALLLEATG